MSSRATVMLASPVLPAKLAALLNPLSQAVVVSTYTDIGTFPLIGTHEGTFHCDEALAVSMLKLLPQYRDSSILRTRNNDFLAQCHIVVDVGAVYDPESHRYDHHQRDFTHVLEGYSTKLSSAGLVYKHFGKAILKEVLSDDEGIPPSEELVETCFHKVYKGFVEHIDAIDNGISVSDSEPRYQVSTTLSSRVHMLNPGWNEPQTVAVMNERFVVAMQTTCAEFLSHVHGLAHVWWPARSIVQDALANRYSVHSSGQIILFEQSCPWKDHLFDLEKEIREAQGEEIVAAPILYALFADQLGSWRIQAIPLNPTSFESRKKLPEEWRGLRDEVLSDKVLLH